jgi:hypothetical protein
LVVLQSPGGPAPPASSTAVLRIRRDARRRRRVTRIRQIPRKGEEPSSSSPPSSPPLLLLYSSRSGHLTCRGVTPRSVKVKRRTSSSSSSSSIVMVKHWLTIVRRARSGRERRVRRGCRQARPGPSVPFTLGQDAGGDPTSKGASWRGAGLARPPAHVLPACLTDRQHTSRSPTLDLSFSILLGSANSPTFLPLPSFGWLAHRVLALLPFSGAGTVPPPVDRRRHCPARRPGPLYLRV